MGRDQSSGPARAPRVALVPHTHWDREWYEPFASMQLRLAAVLDEVLDRLSEGKSYDHFLFDGQMAMVEDYLALRPGAESLIRELAARGRANLGPWYVLPDEFLVSGETLVRNLEMGWAAAARFGPPMAVGYLPDTFGHTAQMPQLLAQAGIRHAVVWRGVPAGVGPTTAFRWSAPDGSVVRAEYLRHGYGNGAFVPGDAAALTRRLVAHRAELGEALAPGGTILFMAGTDHTVPEPWLATVAAAVEQFDVEITALPDYLEEAGRVALPLPTVTGELRSGARADLLIGVTSNRIDVKRAAAAAETILERRAEPLAALFLEPGAAATAQAALAGAWRDVVLNAAHDSICACSTDDVVDDVLTRYARAGHIAEAVAAQAVTALAASIDQPGPIVVNPSARPRRGIVELVEAGDTEVVEDSMPAAEIGRLLAGIRNGQLEPGLFVDQLAVTETAGGLDIAVSTGAFPVDTRQVEETKRDLYARAGAAPEKQVHVRIERRPPVRRLVITPEIPGFGWSALTDPAELVGAVEVDGASMSNGLVTVAVNDNGFSLNGQPGFDRLVDGGDCGDTYTYSPPADDKPVDKPFRSHTTVLERDPLRAKICLRRQYDWGETTSTYELRSGERYVRIETVYDNRCHDHRLRVHFPLPAPATTSRADSAFAIVERSLMAEGSEAEPGRPTFPAHRFIQAGGLTVAHWGLPEYELVDIAADGATALALTLMRAVGMLSRQSLPDRRYPAGPLIPTAKAQLQGRHRFRYAVAVGDAVDPFLMWDDVFLPPTVIPAPGGGTRPPTGSALTIAGAEVSALRRTTDGRLEVRVWNPTGQPTVVEIPGRRGELVDLLGQPHSPFAERFQLGPCSIATARLAGVTPD